MMREIRGFNTKIIKAYYRMSSPVEQSIYRAARDAIYSNDADELESEINDYEENFGNTKKLLIFLMPHAIKNQNVDAVKKLLAKGYDKSWLINDETTTAHESAKQLKVLVGGESAELDVIIPLLVPSVGGNRKGRRNARSKKQKSKKRSTRRRH